MPVDGCPDKVPASAPTFSGLVTPTPINSSAGSWMIWASPWRPVLPVPKCTTLSDMGAPFLCR